MEQTGEVVALKDGMLTIRFDRPEACEKCNACDGSKHQALIEIPGQASVGDKVRVAMPDGQVAKASILAYALPLCGLIGGLVVGNALGQSDVSVLIGGVSGLAVSLLLLWVNEKRLKKSAKWRPHLVAVEKSGSSDAY